MTKMICQWDNWLIGVWPRVIYDWWDLIRKMPRGENLSQVGTSL